MYHRALQTQSRYSLIIANRQRQHFAEEDESGVVPKQILRPLMIARTGRLDLVHSSNLDA